MSMLDMDRRAAEAAHKAIEIMRSATQVPENERMDTLERTATRALGVLQEEGVYAAFLFLLSRSGAKTRFEELTKPEEAAATALAAQLLQLLLDGGMFNLNKGQQALQAREDPAWVNETKLDILRWLADPAGVGGELRRLLIVRSLLERVLTYTRYGARALRPEAEGR